MLARRGETNELRPLSLNASDDLDAGCNRAGAYGRKFEGRPCSGDPVDEGSPSIQSGRPLGDGPPLHKLPRSVCRTQVRGDSSGNRSRLGRTKGRGGLEASQQGCTEQDIRSRGWRGGQQTESNGKGEERPEGAPRVIAPSASLTSSAYTGRLPRVVEPAAVWKDLPPKSLSTLSSPSAFVSRWTPSHRTAFGRYLIWARKAFLSDAAKPSQKKTPNLKMKGQAFRR